MAVDIVIQETIETVDITVNPNIIEVNVTRTSGSGGVQTVTGTTVDNTDPLNPIVGVPNLQQVTDEGATTTNPIVSEQGLQGSEITATNGTNVIGLKPDALDIAFNNGTFESLLTANAINGDYSWELPNQSGTIALTSDITSGIQSVVAGTNVTVDNTDPLNPIISASGGSSNKKEYYAILTYDAGAPTVPIVDEQINEFGAITVTFNDVDGEIILNSSALFVKTNPIFQNILTPLGDPLETCYISVQTDSQIKIQFLTSAYSANPNWFINYPFKIKLEKYVTP